MKRRPLPKAETHTHAFSSRQCQRWGTDGVFTREPLGTIHQHVSDAMTTCHRHVFPLPEKHRVLLCVAREEAGLLPVSLWCLWCQVLAAHLR